MDNKKQYPSLDLAYEQVKGVLSEQEQTARALDTKVATLVIVATAIIGIAIPVVFSIIDIRMRTDLGIVFAVITIVPIAIWVFLLNKAYNAYKLRAFITMNKPEEIWSKLADKQPEEFYYEIIANTQQAFDSNCNHLERKTEIVDSVLQWTRIEVFLTLGWLLAAFVTLAFS